MRRRSERMDVGIDIKEDTPSTTNNNNNTCDASPNHIVHYRRFYIIHITLVLVVLSLGMLNNSGNRKYIPVQPKELFKLVPTSAKEMDMSCHKAYVNVHASTVEEEFASICCFNNSTSRNFSIYESNLCNPSLLGISTQTLPFAKRLTLLTEAWVLPLLPIILRLIYQFILVINSTYTRRKLSGSKHQHREVLREATSFSTSQASSSSLSTSSAASLLEKAENSKSTIVAEHPHTSIRITLRRFLFYFLLLNFRGFGLYIGANALEDYIILPWITGSTVVSPLRTHSMSDIEHDIQYKDDNEAECWYREVLKSHHKTAMENNGHSDCYGRPFDFSDHVVLFLAHYLPIFVFEMLLYFTFPFWEPSSTARSAVKKPGIIWNILHVGLFVYLHLLVLHALYHTAVYFHTPAEIIVGYIVSLVLQLPLIYLMCSEDSLSRLKTYIGLQHISNGSPLIKKGD